MMLTCLKERASRVGRDFPGKTLGVWFFGNEYPFLTPGWRRWALPTDGARAA